MSLPETPPAEDRDTVRVQGVPFDWGVEKLQRFLADQKKAIPTIGSLFQEVDRAAQTATVTFKSAPVTGYLRTNEYIKLPQISNTRFVHPHSLKLDTAFLGLTTLYTPLQEDHKIDVVALSGIGSHAFGSFKERGGDYMWLRDALPYDLIWEETGQPMARITTYGYESHVPESESIANIEDFATEFRESLAGLATASTFKPIILLAHSLGGLIVKEAIISLSKSLFEEHKRLLRAIYGIIFFGVPNEGMDISSLRSMVGDNPNRFLIESISHINSQILTIQQREFPSAFGEKESEIFCFYETCMSRTAQKNDNGKWEMTGPFAYLVSKSSATRVRHWEAGAEHICAIARTHSDLVKFGPYDHEYAKVRERLRRVVRRAATIQYRISRKSAFLVPYHENPNFVGRSGILDTVAKRLGLKQSTAKPHTRVGIYGLGGIGKTQVALAFVYWVRETLPDFCVFWVHGSTAARFRQSYATIAEEFKILGYDDPKINVLELVTTWLEKKCQSQWLMVVDNADDIDLFYPSQHDQESSRVATSADENLGRYIPQCGEGLIIFTTKDKKTASRLAPGKPPIEVSRMEDYEVHSLLREVLGDDDLPKEAMSALASRLEHLPLALIQAAAFIQENGISLSDYVQRLDKSDSALVNCLSESLESVWRDPEIPRAASESWFISFDQIRQKNPFDSDLLSFMSFFHWQAIPKELIEDYYRRMKPEVTDTIASETLIKSLGTLKAFCFISEDKDKNMSMHRLVQLVTRKWLNHRKDTFAGEALKTMLAAYPLCQFETRDVCLRLLPHVYAVLASCAGGGKDDRINRSMLVHRLGNFFLYQGQWTEAHLHMHEALETVKQEMGAEHPDTLVSIANLACTYMTQGNLEEAERLLLPVVKRQRELWPEDPDTLSNMENLGVLYLELGRPEEAEELQTYVMKARGRNQDPEHADSIGMTQLVRIHAANGRLEEAERLGVQVTEAQRRNLGPDHPHTLNSINALVSIYVRQNQLENAERLGAQVTEARRRSLGPDHPDTLDSMSLLAATLYRLGRSRQAIEMMKECIDRCWRVLGPEHDLTKVLIKEVRRWERCNG